ncbi:MAG: tRNA (guanosine(46)-N7)-methyltransferase TrmB [Chlorobi bacterium]|nr:tRNA (guanosine(46)-N7)-methyltransferase TrmB [Chlorobiota bacterium]MCI0716231.1 tRNA (guanosine(46)-N7)-methyltransferase TrmB [Chlorobiota bacterium]
MKAIDYKKYPLPRLRHHANPVLYFPLRQQKGKKLRYPPLIESLNWKDVFVNGESPKYLDVGCGLGKFMIEMAVLNPSVNILGFEVRSGAVDWINRVIAGEKIPNAKALWYSAVNCFPFISDESVEKIFYFFPDPWIKKRHNKRRAFSLELLDELHRVLKPSGTLYIMTDVAKLDEHQREVLAQHSGFSYSYVSTNDWDLHVRTNQEEFCIRKNIPFIRMICVKSGKKIALNLP